jgi:formylglycine-generating enzyme required for sulfatase activity
LYVNCVWANSSRSCLGTVNKNTFGIADSIKVFGIEMVNVPEGPYYLGGSVSGSEEHFHRGDDPDEAFYVNTSGVLTYGSTSNDWATNESFGFTTDIPATYPNGYDQFYAMKYPVTCEQYVEFLNTLTFQQQNSRTESDLSVLTTTNHYVMSEDQNPDNRDGIKADITNIPGMPVTFFCDLNNNGIPNEIDDGQNIVLSNCDLDDFRAYADWAALRPLTMLEHEKMCRGPLPAVKDERAWGTAGVTFNNSQASLTNAGQPGESHSAVGSPGLHLNFPVRVGIAATSTSDRLTSGAGYYGHMHLSSHTDDFYVSAESTLYGLGFTGQTGDGELTTTGAGNISGLPGSSIGYVRKGGNDPIIEMQTGLGVPTSRLGNHSIRVGR